MARRRSATVTVDERVVVVSGWQVGHVLTDAGLRPIYGGSVGGWMLDRRRLPDVLAALQHQGYDARVTEAGDAA